MDPEGKKHKIQNSIKSFSQGALVENALNLLSSLGYQSERRFADLELSPENITEIFPSEQIFRDDKALIDQWKSVHFLFQLTGDEITDISQGRLEFTEATSFNPAIYQSYLFFAIELIGESYTRTQLSEITREINKLFLIPVMVLFKHGNTLTQSIINRRPHKRDEHRDVLEKVTLIKDINIYKPHRAHIEILFDLSLQELDSNYPIRNFLDLHNAWQIILDTSELNKRFFKELANWYFWAIQNVTFPEDAGEDEESRNATSVIRLITRIIFIWFIKEKGMVPDILFDARKLQEILNHVDYNDSTYYKAILQNLFFATLNQEMNTPDKLDKRKFRGKASVQGGRDQHYLIHNVYRYESYFKNSQKALEIFESIPFLNGGLFECLDQFDKDDPSKNNRIDGFSDRQDNLIRVPDFLFFGDEREVDLNKAYGTSRKHYRVCGLIRILNRYKFTIEENTPIEEEIALDPELLGKVFENLLAAYNPETSITARKETGSYYTPREIVDYMVDEALVEFFVTRLTISTDLGNLEGLKVLLHHLFAYTEEPHQFSGDEVESLIRAIDDLNVLDPAVGSGAFPMGVLHKLVFILGKLDPGNQHWKERQIEKTHQIPDATIREQVQTEIERAFEHNELNYGRKLYLIQNCIYGVDIQPIAVQIAKLRLFISLIIDQTLDDTLDNRGIIPLPNLETRFVAANTLIDLEKPLQPTLSSQDLIEKQHELAEIRNRHFTARTYQTKKKYRELDKKLRSEISYLLRNEGFPNTTASQLASWDPYNQNNSAGFFDPQWMFGLNDRFDVVIANPPYVNAKILQKNQPELRRLLKIRYKFLTNKWDLYMAFLERSLQISNTQSIITMIVSTGFVTENYSRKFRNHLINKQLIHSVAFLDFKVFDAGVRNVIILINKNRHNDFSKVLFSDANNYVVNQTAIQNIFVSEESPLLRLCNTNLHLRDVCFISIGMVLNANEKTAMGQFKKKDLVSDTEDKIHNKRYTEGKWIDQYHIFKIKFLEWGTDRVPKKIRRPTFTELYENEKILTNKLGKLKAAYDNSKIICDQTIRILVRWTDLKNVSNRSIENSIKRYATRSRSELDSISTSFNLKYILAMLNSNLYSYLFDLLRTRESFDINPEILKQLPIINISKELQDKYVVLVDKILTILNSIDYCSNLEMQAMVKDYRGQIDQLVYELNDLTAEEIELVEQSVNRN